MTFALLILPIFFLRAVTIVASVFHTNSATMLCTMQPSLAPLSTPPSRLTGPPCPVPMQQNQSPMLAPHLAANSKHHVTHASSCIFNQLDHARAPRAVLHLEPTRPRSCCYFPRQPLKCCCSLWSCNGSTWQSFGTYRHGTVWDGSWVLWVCHGRTQMPTSCLCTMHNCETRCISPE